MTDKLALTRSIDDDTVEIFERTVMIPNPAIGMIPTPMVTETFYVLAAPNWPKVRIRARRGLSRWIKRLRRNTGLSFEDEQLNTAYRVEAEDDDFAIRLLTPQMQAFLLEKTTVDWSAGHGEIKLFYRGGLKKGRVDASLERLRRFRDLIDPALFTDDPSAW